MKESVNMVIEFLNNMATKLSPTAKHVYEVYAHQMFTVGVVQLIVSALSALIAGLFTWLTISFFKDDEIECGMGCGTIMFIAYAIAIGFFVAGFLKLNNPEYYVIQKIIGAVHN